MTSPLAASSRRSRRVGALFTPILALLALTVALAPNATRAQEPVTHIEFLKYGSMATNVAQSADGQYIAIGVRQSSGEGRVVLWSRPQQQRIWSRSFSTQQAPTVSFDSSGTRLAIGAGGAGVTVWHVGDDDSVTPKRSAASTAAIAYGPGTTLATASNQSGRRVRVWTSGSQRDPASFTADAPIRDIAFRPNSSEIAIVTSDTKIVLWNYRIDITNTINTANLCGGKVSEIKISSDAERLYATTEAYASCDPDYLCIINYGEDMLQKRYQRKNISQIEPLGRREVAYSRGRYVYRLDPESGTDEVIYEANNKVHDLAYASGHLVVADSDVVVLEL